MNRRQTTPPETEPEEVVSVNIPDAADLPAPDAPMEPAASPAPLSSPGLSGARIGIIGAGAMGGALCRGLVSGGAAPANKIVIYDPHTDHTQRLQHELSVKVADSAAKIGKFTDIILLCVKPYNVSVVLDEISESLERGEGKPLPLIISIAAGVKIEKIEAHLPPNLPVIRAMPNTPAQVGMGACAYCIGTHADANHAEQAALIFRSVGTAVQVPEAMMDAVTALSGSGPAYVYLMIESLIDGGVKVGLPRDIATQLAAQTVLGAAQMVIETKEHPASLRDKVTTPAGTTITAISALEHSGVRAALIDAVERATIRSRELG